MTYTMSLTRAMGIAQTEVNNMELGLERNREVARIVLELMTGDEMVAAICTECATGSVRDMVQTGLNEYSALTA